MSTGSEPLLVGTGSAGAIGRAPLTGKATESPARQYARSGFLAIPSLTTAEDIALIRSLLDPLFDRFDTLGERAVDLAGPREPGMALRSPEVNEAVKLQPALRKTLAYARCREIAREFLGVPVGYMFDHAIYKPPHNQTPTAWHQDEAYSARPIPLRSVHFWIPLQEATVENGCMWFIPGSHLGPVLPHRVAAKRTVGPNKTTIGVTIATDHVDPSKAVPVPLPVGSASCHHPLTLHYTGANESDGYRRVWILHFGAYGRLRYRLHPKMIAASISAAFRGA